MPAGPARNSTYLSLDTRDSFHHPIGVCKYNSCANADILHPLNSLSRCSIETEKCPLRAIRRIWDPRTPGVPSKHGKPRNMCAGLKMVQTFRSSTLLSPPKLCLPCESKAACFIYAICFCLSYYLYLYLHHFPSEVDALGPCSLRSFFPWVDKNSPGILHPSSPSLPGTAPDRRVIDSWEHTIAYNVQVFAREQRMPCSPLRGG